MFQHLMGIVLEVEEDPMLPGAPPVMVEEWLTGGCLMGSTVMVMRGY